MCLWQREYLSTSLGKALPKVNNNVQLDEKQDESKKYELCKKMFKPLMDKGLVVEIHNQALKVIYQTMQWYDTEKLIEFYDKELHYMKEAKYQH